MDLGLPEIVIILVIVLVLFGGAKLPQLGESLGKGIRSFKDALSGSEEKPATPPPAPPAQPSAPQEGPKGSGGPPAA